MVEYVLVMVLLILVFLAIAQIALVVHARDVLTADAAEGARTSALRDGSLGDGERMCSALVRQTLSHIVIDGDRPCSATYEGTDLRLVRMRVIATVPLTFVPLGHVDVDVSARAIVEPAP